ncbi:MAG: hypothetical protein M1820_009338 [Bogoriella megaspora]|nr:MAG: hypothetical protein M1820_009338 [Bogoriella megaspora]
MAIFHLLFAMLPIISHISASASLVTVRLPRNACPVSSPSPISYENLSQTPTTIISTATVSPTSLPADYALNHGEPFVINVVRTNPPTFQKRQNQDQQIWIMENGNTTYDASQAARFKILDGILYGSNGTMSTNQGTLTMPFVIPQTLGTINTTFAVVDDGLTWSNPEFTAGVAQFYQVPPGLLKNAMVLAKFIGPMTPQRGWSAVNLFAQPVADLNLTLALSSFGGSTVAPTSGNVELSSVQQTVSTSSLVQSESPISSVTTRPTTSVAMTSATSSASITIPADTGLTSLSSSSRTISSVPSSSAGLLSIATASSISATVPSSSLVYSSVLNPLKSSPTLPSTSSSLFPFSSFTSPSNTVTSAYIPSSSALVSSSKLSATNSLQSTSNSAIPLSSTSSYYVLTSSSPSSTFAFPTKSTSSSTPNAASSTAAQPTGPAIVPAVFLNSGIYNFLACYSDLPSSRALRNSNNVGTPNITGSLTVEKCASICGSPSSGGPYLYMGVEYASECYCSMGIYGNLDGTSGGAIGMGNCTDKTYACKGDGREFCGGYGALGIYQFSPGGSAVITSSSSSGSATSYPPVGSSAPSSTANLAITSTPPYSSLQSLSSTPPSTTSTSSKLLPTEPVSSSSNPSTIPTPTIRLPSPTPCLGSPTGAPKDDDDYCEVDLPFPITLFGHSSNLTFPSTNGILAIDYPTAQYIQLPLPTTTLPSYTICAFWDDLYLYGNTNQGVYYAYNESSVTYEFILSQAGVPGDVYQFQVYYSTDKPGVVVLRYFGVGELGGKGVVGVQGGRSTFVEFDLGSLCLSIVLFRNPFFLNCFRSFWSWLSFDSESEQRN